MRDALRLLDGGPEVLGGLAARIHAGTGKVVGELYQASWHPLLGELDGALGAGRHVDVLVNPHIGAPWLQPDTAGLDQLSRHGAVLVPYDRGQPASALWAHAKHWTFEDAGHPLETWLSNLAWSDVSLRRNELTPVLYDARAAAARELTWSAMADDVPRMQAAWTHAGELGIVGTDPRAGVASLASATHQVIADAARGERLLVVTKGMDDPATTQRVVAAHARGADVSVYVRDLAPVDAAMLEHAGVPTQVVGASAPGWRINYVAGPRQATLGTAFLWRQMMDEAHATSRDTGLLLAGAARDQVDAHVQGMVAAAGAGVDIATARALGILKGTNSVQGEMTFDEARRLGLLPATGG